MGKSLFVIGSPFQALCALEAKKHYCVESAVFALWDNTISHKMIEPLLVQQGEIHYIEQNNKGTVNLIKSVRKEIKEKFRNVFVGDYFSFAEYIVAVCLVKNNAKFVYLDDGNSTLAIAPPISRKRPRTKNEGVWYKALGIYTNAIRINSKLFTIYDLDGGCPLPVEKNTFSSLVNKANSTKDGVYVIGTNADQLKFRDKEYMDYLSSLNDWIHEKYGDVKVYYCPHRSDKTNSKDEVISFGWKVFDTKVSVEVDFVNNSIYPLVVVGFGSTALLTLKKMFPESEVHTIVMNFVDESFNKIYREIEDYYSNNRIASIII